MTDRFIVAPHRFRSKEDASNWEGLFEKKQQLVEATDRWVHGLEWMKEGDYCKKSESNFELFHRDCGAVVVRKI